MADILMLAEPASQPDQNIVASTTFLSAEEFYADEDLVKSHDEIIWSVFHTHSKYMRKARLAGWFCVAHDNEHNYLSSAFVIDAVEMWLIENVMTDPEKQRQGAGTAVMARLMQEAKKRNIPWVVLHCDPEKNDGALPKFYANFGFHRIDS